MTEEQRYLLQVLAEALFGRKAEAPGKIDWQAFLQESAAQSVLSMALAVTKPLMPWELVQKYRVKESRIIAGSMKLENEHAELHEIMSRAGIDYAVIKGSASAAYYPEAMLRTMGDVDFFVERSDLERAGRALEEAGFSAAGKKGRYHIAYRRTEKDARLTEWEMHWEANGIPDSREGDQIRLALGNLISQATVHEGAFGPYRVPSPFHHGLVILLHTANHLINSGVGLRHLCDWAVFSASMDEETLRRLFEPFLRQTGLWTFFLSLTAVCARYLGAGNEWTLDLTEDSLTEQLMEDILSAGNFGAKDDQRINQAKLLTTKASSTVDDAGMLHQLLRTMNEKARKRMPICKKIPILLPIGWIFAAGTYLSKQRRGRRPRIELNATLTGARQRKAVYRQLHLFEKDAS